MRLPPALHGFVFGFGCPVMAMHHHLLHMNEAPVMAFDHTVLGNLQSDTELEAMEGMQVPDFHLFTAKISVGSPPQLLTCLLDSGSADLWIPSKRCKACEGGHHFKADESKSFMPAVVQTPEGLVPVPVQVSYGRGDIVGFLVQDYFSLASHRFKNQSFIIVEDEQLPMERTWDGVCGLGWKQLTGAGRPMYKNVGESEEPTFSLIPGAGQTTVLTVGALSKRTLNMPTMAWASAIPLAEGENNSYWVVHGAVRAFSGRGDLLPTAMHPHGRQPEISAKLLVDTANAYIMLPKKYFKLLLETLLSDPILHGFCGMDPSQGNLVVCDCGATKENEELKKAHFAVVLDGKNFAIKVPDLFKRVPAKEGEADLCLLLIQQAPEIRVLDPIEVLADLIKATATGNAAPPSQILAPFLFPGLLPADLPSNGGQQPEQIEEIREMRNGKLCTTTLVWVAEKLKQNTTSCKDEEKRRLQGVSSADPVGEVIVLGGVFLEHFAVVFDFKHSRLGLSDPKKKAASLPASARPKSPTYFRQRDANGGTLTFAADAHTAATVQKVPGTSLSSVFFVAVVVLAACVGNFWYQSKRRRNSGRGRHEDSDDSAGRLVAVAE